MGSPHRINTTRITGCLLSFWLVCSGSAFSAPTNDHRELVLWYRNYDNPAIRTLVQLALDKTPEYGSYQLLRSEEISQGRALKELTKDRDRLLDIANVATSVEREISLNPIPVPVHGGLLGFRVCLILPENLALFEGINDLQDLRDRGIRIGQGSHWPDTPVLKANGITVVTNPRFEVLFGMLQNNRFDCFARSISEVMFDLEFNNSAGVVIEPDLLIAYPLPSYLFAARNDEETAHRLQLGIERAFTDGSFAVYLKNSFGRAIKELGLKSRKVITLQNPYLSEDSAYIGRQALENLSRRIDYLSQ